ncbi:MAG: lipopolysaccharide biosynthesis protein [Actinomycetota bacterium]
MTTSTTDRSNPGSRGGGRLRSSAAAIGGTAIGAAANFAALAVVAAFYDEVTFGTLSAVTAIFQLTSVSIRLGTDVAATYFIGREANDQRIPQARRVLTVTVIPVAAVTSALAAIVILQSDQLASWLAKPAEQAEYAQMLEIIALALPLSAVGEVLMSATRGFGSMFSTVIGVNLGRQCGQLILIGAAAIFAAGESDVLAAAWAAPFLATLLVPAGWLMAKGILRAAPARQPQPTGTVWAYAVPQAAGAAVQGGLEKADIMMLNTMVGAEEAGQYNLANRFVHLFVLVRYALGTAHAAALAQDLRTKNYRAVNLRHAQIAAWSLVLCGPGLVILAAFPRAVLGLVGDGYTPAASALQILTMGLLGSLLLGHSLAIVSLSGSAIRVFVYNAASLLMNVAANVVLIREYGTAGAAWAWAAATVLPRAAAHRHIRRRFDIRIFTEPVVFATIVTGVIAGLAVAGRLALGDERIGVFVTIPIAIVVWAGMVAAWRRRLALQRDPNDDERLTYEHARSGS